MPRVGSHSSRMRGSSSSHLPITTFCWLPPDSVATGSSGTALICMRRMMSPTAPRSRARSSSGPRRQRDSVAAVRLSATDIASISPSVLRSSGISAIPSGERLRGERTARRDRLAVDAYLAGAPRQAAEQRQQELALALAVEAAQPEDLARGHLEADAAQPVLPAELVRAQDRRARLGVERAAWAGTPGSPRGRSSCARSRPRHVHGCRSSRHGGRW